MGTVLNPDKLGRSGTGDGYGEGNTMEQRGYAVDLDTLNMNAMERLQPGAFTRDESGGRRRRRRTGGGDDYEEKNVTGDGCQEEEEDEQEGFCGRLVRSASLLLDSNTASTAVANSEVSEMMSTMNISRPDDANVMAAAMASSSTAGSLSTKWGLFLIGNVAISLAALGVLARADFHPRNKRELILLGISSVSIAVPITYGVGGHWRYGTYGWQFWQPFRGGMRFVLLQALSWIFFAFTGVPWVLFLFHRSRLWLTVGQCTDVHVSLEDFAHLPRALLLFIGASGVVSEVMMALSLLLFSTSETALLLTKENEPQKKKSSSCFGREKEEVPFLSTTPPSEETSGATISKDTPVLAEVEKSPCERSWIRRSPMPSTDDGCQCGGSGAYIVLLSINLTLATLSCTLAAASDFYTHWGLHVNALPGPISAMFSTGADTAIGNSGMAAVTRVAGLGSKGAAVVGAAVGTMGCAAGAAIGTAAAAASVTVEKAIVALVCAACLCVVVPLTHGLGGKLRYRHLPWAFWQPFVGGLRFVIIQALAWSLFAAALVTFGAAAYCAMFITGAAIGQGLMASAGFSGLASEILLAFSLLCFQPSSQKGAAKVVVEEPAPSVFLTSGSSIRQMDDLADVDRTRAADQAEKKRQKELEAFFDSEATVADCATEVVFPRRWRKELLGAALLGPWRSTPLSLHGYMLWALLKVKCWASLSLLYCPHYLFLGVVFLPLMLLPMKVSVPFLTLLGALYFPTYLGQPHRTDRRTWEASKHFFIGLLEEASVYHFSGLRIVRDSKDPFPSTGRYIFAYHPHGMYPATMSWFHLTEAWRRLFPGITPVALAATAVFYVPILRDLVLWVGTQEVSRKVFRSTLHNKNAVFLCPGGQSELAYHCPRKMKQVILCSRKRGFVREAMEAGASLVPVFCFGEAFAFHNFFDWPSAQRYTYRRLGFPVPFMPVGVGGVLPLPRPERIAIVVGKPIPTTPQAASNTTGGTSTLEAVGTNGPETATALSTDVVLSSVPPEAVNDSVCTSSALSSGEAVAEKSGLNAQQPLTAASGRNVVTRWFASNLSAVSRKPTRRTRNSEHVPGCQRFSEEEVEAMRKKYFDALLELYEKYKAQFGYDDVQLILKEKI